MTDAPASLTCPFRPPSIIVRHLPRRPPRTSLPALRLAARSTPLEHESMATERPRTLGELTASGYKGESVKDEMRRNLIRKIRAGQPLFPDILGYEETVVPQIQNAILSKHDMLFL